MENKCFQLRAFTIAVVLLRLSLSLPLRRTVFELSLRHRFGRKSTLPRPLPEVEK